MYTSICLMHSLPDNAKNRVNEKKFVEEFGFCLQKGGSRVCSEKMDEGGSSQWQLINSIKSAEGGGWGGEAG